ECRPDRARGIWCFAHPPSRTGLWNAATLRGLNAGSTSIANLPDSPVRAAIHRPVRQGRDRIPEISKPHRGGIHRDPSRCTGT
ncbi:hypothetical protein P0Y35_17440, partial [Kiritimatiellaeota bacterium B1221]|nr:hypothetical protein [Kiritimatiellaeota bacterium B1221]